MKVCLLFLCGILPALTAQSQSLEKRVTPVDAARAAHFISAEQVGVAVLVGVGKYPRFSGLSELRYPVADVDALAAILKQQRYLVLTLKDSEATKGAVLNAIEQAGQTLEGENATMLFFFSGHGFAVNAENYLATLDADAKNLAASGLNVKEVEAAMSKAQTTRRMLWIDACRDEPSKGVGEARSFANLQASAGTKMLLSTRAGKVSYEDDELKQGLFSYFLAKGMRGEAAGPDGLVTFQDLSSYVTLNVRARSLETGRAQVPYQAGESSGDFLVARAGAPQLASVPPPISTANPANGVDPAEEAWSFVKDSQDPNVLEDFARRFPTSSRAQVATLRASQLRRLAMTPAPVAAAARLNSIVLTRAAPSAERSATITAPGLGMIVYNVFYIDTRDFASGGLLSIDIKIDKNSGTDGSFDLYRGDAPAPKRGHVVGELTGSYDVRKGSSTRLEYKFATGDIFALGLEGNWFSPKGATGMVHFTVRVKH